MSGFLEPVSFYAQFGIVDVDWSNAKSLWVVPPMSSEELLVEQAARLKAERPSVKVFVYRNIVKVRHRGFASRCTCTCSESDVPQNT